MKLYLKILGAIVFVVIAAVLTWVFIPRDIKDIAAQKSEQRRVTIGWELLRKLNYETGEAPPEVKDLHGRKVKIPGFIVPLTDRLSVLKEFLLVPDPQSCIHVPPPPPNLIVYVKLKKAIPFRQAFNPAWVSGILRIFKTESSFGYASYRMDVASIERYRG